MSNLFATTPRYQIFTKNLPKLAVLGLAASAGLAVFNHHHVSAMPAAFTDKALYQCVVYAYNHRADNAYLKTADKSYTLPKAINNTGTTTNLTATQLKQITVLNCPGRSVADTSGLEKLTNLTSLNLSDNRIKKPDLSKNKKLVQLNLNNNQITSLSLTANTKLTYLSVKNNRLGSLNLTKNTKLTTVYAQSNSIKNLDLSKNTKITTIAAEYAYVTLPSSKIKVYKYKDLYAIDLSKLPGNYYVDSTSYRNIYQYNKTYKVAFTDNLSKFKEYFALGSTEYLGFRLKLPEAKNTTAATMATYIAKAYSGTVANASEMQRNLMDQGFTAKQASTAIGKVNIFSAAK